MKKLLKLGIAMFAFLAVLFVVAPPQAQAADRIDLEQLGSLTINKRVNTQISMRGIEQNLPTLDGVEYKIQQTHELNEDGNLVAIADLPDAIIGTTGVNATNATNVTSGEGWVKFSELSLGRYTVQEIEAPAGYIVDPRVYTVDIPETNPTTGQLKSPINYDVVLYPKNEKVNIFKTSGLADFIEDEYYSYWQSTGDLQEGDEVLVGDFVMYQISVDLPFDLVSKVDDGGIEKNKYAQIEITDKLDPRLTLIEADYSEYLTGDTTNGELVWSFEVEDILDILGIIADEYSGYHQLNINVVVQVNDLAIDNAAHFNNTAEIIYTVNNEEGTQTEFPGEIETPKVEPITGQISLNKIDSVNRKELPEVEFALYKVPTDGDTVILDREETIAPAITVGGEIAYLVIGTQDTPTDANGEILWTDLPLGIYFVKETQPLPGYNELYQPIRVELTRANDGIYTIVNLENVPKGRIPETGGMGTIIFTIIGLGLMGGAAYVLKKKDNKEESTNEENAK